MSAAANLVYKTHDNVRMAGFLEKKGKMKLMSQWKKYWFVLEETLLLYYRSEVEYTNLSPCRGSLNMGLVTTVRPGASSGPCIIHVITRTQVVQLRAKNRATQEEWLQALLHSMSLPLVPKTLQPHITKKSLLGYGLSLDNITCKHKENVGNSENEWTFPRKLDYRKRQISGSVYGGSLDTAIWSKKLNSTSVPSPSVPKGKIIEKILGFTAERDFVNVIAFPKNSRLSLNEDNEMKYIGESETDESWKKERNVKCKVHDENRNHELYSKIGKRKKKIIKTLSDTELNKKWGETDRKEESPFDRLKNVLSRIPKDKILKVRSEAERRTRPIKKRRQSFLQKVFKKRGDSHESESDVNDPLYDTIGHTKEQFRSSIPDSIVQNEAAANGEEEKPQEDAVNVESLYAEVKKPLVGSKTILPARTLSELRLKLKSRENVDEGMSESIPALPPRRMSRPISPWHDVPTNNAPVGDAKLFFVHQAVVKFNDSIPPIDSPKTENEFSDTEEVDGTAERQETSTFDKKKNDDLSMLLDQLTKITVAPLAEPELTDDTYNSSSDSEKFWTRSQFSDPDYDIPRPHRPLRHLSQGREVISSTQFMGRCDNNSDTSSFRSMEPDSLEMIEKKANLFP